MRTRRSAGYSGLSWSLLVLLLAAIAPSATPAAQQKDPQSVAPPASSKAPVKKAVPGPLNTAQPIALATIAEKAARYPDNPYILNEYANQLLQSARLKEAVAMYRKAVKLNPAFVKAWNNLGIAYRAVGKLGRSVGAFKKALGMAPNYAIVHYNLGVTYDAQKKYQKAIRSYQRALELDPGLLKVENNPQIGINRHVSAILLQSYVDRGGEVFFPVLSSYPEGD